MKWQSRFTGSKLLNQIIITAISLVAVLGTFSSSTAMRRANYAVSAQTQEASKTLYFPRLHMGKGWKATITLTNQEDRELTSTIKTFNADGTQQDEIAPGKLPPRWRFRDSLSEQYGMAAMSLTQLAPGESKTIDVDGLTKDVAALQAEANGHIIGHVTLSSPDGSQATDIPAVDELSTTLSFPKLSENDAKHNSLSLFNPGKDEATLEVIAFGTDSQVLARRWLPSLASTASRTVVLSELLEGISLEQVVNIQVMSNAELAGIQVPTPTENDWFSAAAIKENRETAAKLAVTALAPTSVLSPVEGSLRVTTSNLAIQDGKWEFNQHKTGLHKAGGGIGGSNDTYAWDANLYTQANRNADVGMNVYATAEGDVVTFAGVGLSNSCNAVLIAHPNKTAPEWWSGYLHLQSQNVTLNQHVTAQTVIGKVGRACADNDHLHFVVYTGQNKSGGLVSFNASIIERGTGPSYEGYHDRADCNLIEGWAWDRNQPNTPINVDIYDGGSKIMTVLADRFRQDLLNAGKGNGYHGFSVATPASLKNGYPHTIYVKYGGTSNNLDTTGKTITCQTGTKASMTSPVNGSTFTSSIVTFYWDAGVNVSEYFLYVGSSQGANDLYGASQGLSRSRTVSNLPTDGRLLYVRLWSLINGSWQYNDYSYRAYSNSTAVRAAITSPPNGSTLTSLSVTFYWNSGIGVSEYFLYVGTCSGCNNIYGQSQGTSLSRTVSGIPASGTVYVRLWSLINGGWQYNDYVYTARR